MKKQLCIVSAWAFVATAFAQPSLNSTNSNPVIGDQYTLISGSWISEGGPGASQAWDFSTVTTTVSTARTYTVQTLSPGNATAFPNANVQSAGINGSTFLKTSSSALQNFGIASGTVQIRYSDAEDQMRYPCAMGDTYSDAFAATFSSGGNNFVRKGTATVTADAYGTLRLPGGMYSSVLRVHLIQDYTDSTNIGGTMPYTIYYYNDQYMWYLPNNHMPIFGTYSLAVSGTSSPSKGSTTLQSIANSIGELEAGIKSMNLYPNPANGEFINMDLNLEKNIRYSIVITDNLGREVMNTESLNGMEGYNFRSLNISGIESGLYQLVLKSEGQPLKTTKIVVVR